MRPTPSPTGSTGSRSMSPAVGQQNIPMPPRPSSGQSDGSGSTRISHSPMATQGSYPPPHMHGAYKGHPGMQPSSGQQQMPIYQPNTQYPPAAYAARPVYPNQGYGPPASQPPPNNSMPPQPVVFPNRGVPNHSPQFPPYQQPWPGGPPVSAGNHLAAPGKGGSGPPPPAGAPNSPSSGPQRPPHYLKQHLHNKMGFGGTPPSSMPPSPSPPTNYHMGPPPVGHHLSGMGPPPSMGPPNMPPATSPLLQNNHPHDGGPMPPPASTPNSHHPLSAGPPPHEMMDNGITTTAGGGMGTHVTSAAGGSVTSVVTTGPDGTPIDEGSQQSTLSNASAASGEDPQCTTPKSRKNDMGHYSHPTTPQSTVPSPGAASMNSMHEEYEISSPSWPRTPASPVFNTHQPPQETYRSKKTDSLGKLYEMDDNPDRRGWLDKLLAFMEERRTPITTCPTISKNPLDLFRLYMFVKDRGGFMEVTKNKTWKDIAGMLGIGASSSAAYTLRKHYTKNLLAYECQFDRGGIDPQPIINQVESTSKKKSAKAASVPSPGSSNSQDSFPAQGSGGASMDGYGSYGYPPGSNPEYNTPQQRPSSQANAPSPHGGSAGSNHLGNAAPSGPTPVAGAADNVSVSNPFDDVSPSPPPRGGPFPGGAHPPFPTGTPPRPPGQNYPGQAGSYNQYPPPSPGQGGPGAPPDQYSPYPGGQNYPQTRPVYPPYSTDSNAPPASPNSSQPGAPPQGGPPDAYSRYNMNAAPTSGGYPPRPAFTGGPNQPPATHGGPPPSGPPPQPPATGAYPPQQDYYRPDQPTSSPGAYPGGPPSNKSMPPPRRHPDFAKDQPPPGGFPPGPYGPPQRPPIYGGWSNNNQFRGPYPANSTGPGGPGPAPGQPWNQGQRPIRPPNQWDPYTPNQTILPPPQGPQQWSPMPTPGVGQSSPLRPPMGPRPGKPFNMMPPSGGKGMPSPSPTPGPYPQGQVPKREITFPPDSVEATQPVLYRRKRLCRADVGPCDAWRIIMCLRSGLLAESVFALDVLTVLLYDDSAISYFGLTQWPGLLDLLLEHFRKTLTDMFDVPCPTTAVKAVEDEEVDLGAVVTPLDTTRRTVVLHKVNNYTMASRKGLQVKIVEKDEEIFIWDHHRKWDCKGDVAGINLLDEISTDPWYLTAEHILPTFQAEFGRIPFNRILESNQQTNKEVDPLAIDNQKPGEAGEVKIKDEPLDLHSQTVDSVVSKSAQCKSPPAEVIPTNKPCDKKRRTKTISDVISRIKKDTPEEMEADADVKPDKEEEKHSPPTEGENKTKVEVGAAPVDAKDSETVNCNEQSNDDDAAKVASVDLNMNSSVNGEGEESAVKEDALSKFKVRDIAGKLKRRRMSDYEDEAYTRDDASLALLTESQDCIAKRCVCISNILRSLTFVPGNEMEFSKSVVFLGMVGKLLLLHHDHPIRAQKTRNYDREEDADFADSCSSLQGESEWWWDFLLQIRENVLVCVANIAGQIDLDLYPEEVARPFLDGLLHWAICPSAQGQDPFPSVGPSSLLSPQRLALEALCKLCVTNSNVDLVIATPPFSRLERLCAVLTKHLCRSEDQVLREFSINLLHYLAAADSSMARVVAMQQPCVSLLVAFIEQAEQSALGVANQHGISALRENPDSMGTSLDMLRRAASTLVFLAEHADNRPLLVQQESRLLALVMSQILDQQVALLLSKVLYKISHS
ncbi:trithorax group protein osa isoform X4 [Atheta coriaria]